MITTNSKNNSFTCIDEICINQIASCEKCAARAEQQVHPLANFLQAFWINIRLFLGTDRWNNAITLQRGDSHYTMKMEDIESRWRNK